MCDAKVIHYHHGLCFSFHLLLLGENIDFNSLLPQKDAHERRNKTPQTLVIKEQKQTKKTP